jgi:aspartate kinase
LQGLRLTIEDVMEQNRIPPHLPATGGPLPQRYFSDYTDLSLREDLKLRNAVTTAEGALELILHNTDRALFGMPCLIIGYGAIGARLAQILSALGAKVTVAARRPESRLQAELARHSIVVVAGFQGINRYDDLTTLGRGGSDTSAVAIAAALHADKCQIFTDVEGVYTADPRKVEGARKLQEITYDEMLELATLGAQVLNNRSVEMAKKYNVEMEVLSSLKRVAGTKVKEVTNVEKMMIKGVAKDEDIARVSIVALPDSPGIAFKVFSRVAKAHICVDNILQSVGRQGTKDIAFTVPASSGDEAVAALKEFCDMMGAEQLKCDTDVAKISIVGAGMETHEGVAADMFEALAVANINIQTITSSEIRVSVLVEKKDADRAVEAVHRHFFGE